MAETLAELLGINGVVLLFGELGAGKTTLARAVLRQFGYRGRVGSPSFDLVRRYRVDFGLVYHVDLYRLQDPAEVAALDLPWIDPTAAASDGTVLIGEWASALRDRYPQRFEVEIVAADPARPDLGRYYRLTARGDHAERALAEYRRRRFAADGRRP